MLDVRVSWSLSSLHELPSWAVVFAEDVTQGCYAGILYHLAGLAGVVAVAFGCWAVAEMWSAALQVVRPGRSGRRLCSIPRSIPGHGTANLILRQDVTTIDVSSEVNRRKRSVRTRLVATLLVFFALAVLVPSPVVVIFFFLFGLFALTIIAIRDLVASGFGETPRAGSSPSPMLAKVGPPLRSAPRAKPSRYSCWCGWRRPSSDSGFPSRGLRAARSYAPRRASHWSGRQRSAQPCCGSVRCCSVQRGGWRLDDLLICSTWMTGIPCCTSARFRRLCAYPHRSLGPSDLGRSPRLACARAFRGGRCVASLELRAGCRH